MSLNIRSIPAFEKLSDQSIELINRDAEYLSYKMGSPLLKKDFIPNQVLIILSGKARLLHKESITQLSTITLLGPDDFIGLSSILIAAPCELLSASSEIIAMKLSDNTILKLYKEDKFFQNWCNSVIQPAELLELSIKLNKNLNNSFPINKLFNILKENVKINVYENNSILTSKNNNLVNLVGSGNINEKEIGGILKSDELISTRGFLPARIFEISQNIYSEINTTTNLITNDKEALTPKNLETLNIKESQNAPGISTEEIGQYIPTKKFKVISGQGPIRESLACIKMLASELELPYKSDSIEKILRDTIRQDKKPTLQLLGGITSGMGLYSTIARVDSKMGNRILSPAIIQWRDSFAIVKNSKSSCLEIVSPVDGEISLNPEQLEENFDQGYIEVLLLEKNEQTPDKKFGLQWLLPSINKFKGSLLQVLLASAVVQLFGLANPLMIQVIIDKVISQRSLDTLQILGVALVFVTLIGSAISSLRTFLFTETTNRIDTRLGAEVIDHLLRLPLNYFDRRPVGELGSRVAELEKIRNFLTGQALTTILDSVFSIIYIVIMVVYSWLLTLIALGVVPIQMLITLIGAPLIRRQIREIAQENAKTQSHLVEVLTGIQTVKAQNVENISRWKWQELYGKYISKSFQKTIVGTGLGESSKVLQDLSQLIVLWVGARLVLEGQLSLGQLIAFRIISGYVTQPLLRLSTIWQNIQELRVSFERLADIIDTPKESTEAEKQKIPLPSLKGDVDFQNITFTFLRGQPDILSKINLKVKSGQFIGIVGQSGSGKSTLMKLLPRLYKPNMGKILIDGYDIDKVELYSLRRQIGIVPQEPLLFAGSVNENIALTDPEATSDEIVKASKIASAHDFIMNLDEGYSTNIGERGAGLSGGQKQRIAIARTILSNPKLLIMDEATSALDYETERKVCEGIRKSCRGSTVFFITHRLSTVRNSDLIVMLQDGYITEQGTHKELMDLKGRYFALYRQQEST